MAIDTLEQHYLVPEHLKGIQKDLYYAITLESGEDANDWFVETMDRLLKINTWNKLSDKIGLLFTLCDNHGKNTNRRAHRGDYVKIISMGNDSIPDHDPHWMHVEAIEYDDYPDQDKETIALHLQPSIGPFQRNGHNHEYDNMQASGTFVIERTGKQISANYHSRNDVSEVSATNQSNDILASIISWFSVTDAQWESLLKAQLE